VAKELHWVCAIDDGGKTLLSRKLRNDPDDLAALVAELHSLGGERRVGIDVMGGIATAPRCSRRPWSSCGSSSASAPPWFHEQTRRLARLHDLLTAPGWSSSST
jgi:hypothetical protein